MCNNCQYNGIYVSLPSDLAAENEELKKQVSALTQALETQNRENKPYIKKLEGLLKQAKGIMERNMVQYPDRYAVSDMLHFVYNDLESLFPSPCQPLNNEP